MTQFINYLRERTAAMPYRYRMAVLAFAAFGCYTSMYAFRKAFTAGTFENGVFLDVNYKVWLVIAQVFGYMLSKFYGIRFIAELGQARRGYKIIGLVGAAWAALLGFALVPAPYNIVFLFMNGLPLGVIWGLVFSYLEGRRATEFLGAVMSVSLVFASGFVKTIARTLMENAGISEFWMPFCTGLLFVIPLVLCTCVLEAMPLPDEKDKALRTERKPMGPRERLSFLRTYLPGLLLTVLIYLLFTIIRDVRDNFEVEIWADIGITGKAIYAKTDSAIAIAVLLMLALLIFVRSNFTAFRLIHAMIIAGCILAGGATLLFERSVIGGVAWMSIAGLGLYMVYIPYNAIFFERMLATFRCRGNVGFVMYIADAVGYLGSVAVLIIRELGFVQLSWGSFYRHALIISAFAGGICISLSLLYFSRKRLRPDTEPHPAPLNTTISYSKI